MVHIQNVKKAQRSIDTGRSNKLVIDSECFCDTQYIADNDSIVILSKENGALSVSKNSLIDFIKELTEIAEVKDYFTEREIERYKNSKKIRSVQS